MRWPSGPAPKSGGAAGRAAAAGRLTPAAEAAIAEATNCRRVGAMPFMRLSLVFSMRSHLAAPAFQREADLGHARPVEREAEHDEQRDRQADHRDAGKQHADDDDHVFSLYRQLRV